MGTRDVLKSSQQAGQALYINRADEKLTVAFFEVFRKIVLFYFRWLLVPALLFPFFFLSPVPQRTG